MKADIKFIFWILFLFSDLHCVVNFNSKNSAIIIDSGSTLNIASPWRNFRGTLIKEADAILMGEPVSFDNGILEDAGNELKLSTTFEPLINRFSFLGSNSLRGGAGTILQSIGVSGLNNRLEGNSKFSNDITLQDVTSGLTMAIDTQLDHNIVLNDGQLFLDSDLKFSDDKQIIGPGIIDLNGHKLTFGGKDLTFSHSLVWQNAADVTLTSKINLSSSLTFNGVNNLNGNGNIINFLNGGGIYVGPGGTLAITDIVFKNLGVMENQLGLLDDLATVSLSNVYIELDNNINNTVGGFYIEGSTTFGLKNYKWTFDQLSSVTIDGVTLWLDSLDEINPGSLVFGTPEENYLSLISGGTIKECANGDTIRTDTTVLGNNILYNSQAIVTNRDDINLNSNSIVTNADDILHNSQAIATNRDDIASNSQAVITNADNILYNSQAIVTNADNILYNSLTIISIAIPLIPIDLHNASGVIVLDKQIGINFTVHPALALHLTLSKESVAFARDEETELKITDSIQVKGRNNVIDLINTFTISGNILFEPDSELIFEFNDRGDNPTVYLANNITVSPNSRLAFKGKGTLKLKDGVNIIFEGNDTLSSSELWFENRALMILEENATVTLRGATSLGFGELHVVHGGEIRVRSDRHLIIGTAETDTFRIFVDDNGMIKVGGDNSYISLQKTTVDLDFEQSGLLFVQDGGTFEVNAIRGNASAGRVGSWEFGEGGILSVDEGGVLIIGENLAGTSFNWDNTGGNILEDTKILSNGSVRLLSESGFIGLLPKQSFALSNATALQLVSALLQRATLKDIQDEDADLSISVLFIDSDGNRKVRLSSGQIVTLSDGAVVIKDDSTTGIVYGVKADERSFAIEPTTSGSPRVYTY
ncbi:hypothetical protein KAW80_03665 [Candidatus Babeliales bacterium]|nr:hypothetical protein [Candidatus Babeliales bacterium]